MQNDDLPVLQVGRGDLGDIGMGRGRQHHHDHLGVGNGFGNVRRDQGKLAKTARAVFAAFQFDAPAFFHNFDMLKGAVPQRDIRPHQRQVSRHGFSAVAGPNDRKFLRCFPFYCSFKKHL